MGVLLPAFAILRGVARDSKSCSIVAGVFVVPSSNSAEAPATWGDAMEVPLKVAVATSLEMPADSTESPGANRSTHFPQFE